MKDLRSEMKKLPRPLRFARRPLVVEGVGATRHRGCVVAGRRIAMDAIKKVGKASERVATYADDNTALVTVAAFGVGLLVGYLVSRKS